MKKGNALNVANNTFSSSYLEPLEPLILVMVSKQTLDQKEAGPGPLMLIHRQLGKFKALGHRNTVGSDVDNLVQKTGHQQQSPGNRVRCHRNSRDSCVWSLRMGAGM